MIADADSRYSDVRRAVLWIGGFLFAALLVRTAWLSDDAYITFRTVENLLNGYGPRWNVANRVQAYTHPLWMLLVTGAVAITREVYFTAIALCIALSTAAVMLVAGRLATSIASAVLALSMLLLSKAFVDYSTSGLENPLTHLLLAAFFAVYFWSHPSPRRLLVLSLIASLAMLNRMDIGLVLLPALVVAVWREGVARCARPLLLGFLPFIAWEIFSIVYYGFPFPNTAYSKLKTGIPQSELLYQGFLYLLDSLSNDPLTLLVIGAGVMAPFLLPGMWVLTVGSVLYLGYTVWIGGDFMSGRFLIPPFLCAVVQVARYQTTTKSAGWWGLMAAVWLVGLSAPRPTLFSNAEYGADIERAQAIAPTGITDERRYYYPQTGLLTISRGTPRPNHKWITMGHELRASRARYFSTDAAGFIGFAAGPDVHFLDKYGLGDPLIARLPSETPWRIGHFQRRPPEGYEETLKTGTVQIRDLGVRRYYEELRLITEGPIWSARRWRSIVRMNAGRYESLLSGYGVAHASIADLSGQDPARSVVFGLRGLEVSLSGPQRLSAVELSVSRNDDYRLAFLRSGREVAHITIEQTVTADGGLATHARTLAEPVEADLIRIVPSNGDSRYSLGMLRVLP